MTVFRKIIFVFTVLAFLAAATWGYFYIKNIKRPSGDAFTVLPDSCLVYVRTADAFDLQARINSRSVIADRLKAFGEVRSLFRILGRCDSLLSSNEAVREQLADAPLHFALYGNKRIGWALTFNIRELGKEEATAAEFVNLLRADEVATGIFRTSALTGSESYFTFSNGVVVMADSEGLLRRCTEGGSKFHLSSGYQAFSTTFSESNQAAVYIDHAALMQSTAGRSLLFPDLFRNGISSGAVTIDPSAFTMNGYFSCEKGCSLASLAGQEAQSADLLEGCFPYNTVSFRAWGFSALRDLTALQDTDAVRDKFWKTVDDTARFRASSEFVQNAAHFFADFRTAEQASYLVLRSDDTLKAREHLLAMSDTSLEMGGRRLYRMHKQANRKLRLFFPFSDVVTAYAMVLGERLYFGEGAAELARLAGVFEYDGLLENDPSFANYSGEQLSEDFNFIMYDAPSRIRDAGRSFFRFPLKEGAHPYSQLRHLSVSMANSASSFRYRLHLLHEAESGPDQKKVLWSFRADTVIRQSPLPFVNHLSRENEVVFQDLGNSLYLVNAKGNLVWKKRLDEKIISAIYMVDMFRNGKFQLLFNTPNHLHIVDRNGNYVEGYPVKLPAPASAGLLLSDYDSNKDYRIIVPCTDRRIYNYGIAGLQHPGFTPLKTDHPVDLPVQYVKAGPYDYLVAVDKEGKIYVFSRKGQLRINLRNRTVADCRGFYVDAGNNAQTTFLIYTDDRNALINKISFTDKKEIVHLDADMSDAFVAFNTVDDNRMMDVIIASGNTATAYDAGGNVLLQKSFLDELSAANYFGDESRSLFYALSAASGRLYLWDPVSRKAKSHPATSMPLIMDLFNDHKKYLLVPDGSRLNCLALD